MSENSNIFVSHIHEDDAHIDAMKKLLKEKGHEVKDSSINSSNPNDATNSDYIKSQILAPRIDWAGTMVVLISPDTKSSEYVDWEIEYANKHDKRIVGVWVHGAAETDIPEALAKYGDAVVGWNGERISDAISGRLDNWEGPDGTPRTQMDIARHAC